MKAGIRKGDGGRRSSQEMQIGEGIRRARQGDGLREEVEGCHRGRQPGQFRSAVACATAHVEYSFATGEARSEEIAREMLVPEVRFNLTGNYPLTREFKHVEAPDRRRVWTSGLVRSHASNRTLRRPPFPSAA